MPLDYFVGLMRGPAGSAPPRDIVVDTGMSARWSAAALSKFC
jgi:hypothetical protein